MAELEERVERYLQLVAKLTSMVRPGFGGASSPQFVAEVERITREIEREANHHSYVREKTASLREWVSRACSRRRYQPWGLEKVEHFAFEDAHKLEGATSFWGI